MSEHNGHSVAIVGTGSYLPAKVLTNDDLSKIIDTTDEWIQSRTGICERRIAADDEATSDMCAVAATRALEQAGVAAEEVGLIIVATVTPDMVFPSTACFVQHKIGATNAFCFDIEAACSGFLFSLDTARRFLDGGSVETALVIGGEKLSTVTDWEDRATCVLFGDGAGAVVLQRKTNNGRGILESVAGSDGGLAHLLNIPGGGSRNPTTKETIDQRLQYMKMAGNEVFKHAVRCMCDAATKVLEKANLTWDEVTWVVPHQANMRIISAIANRFDGNIDKFCVNLDRYGNMSGASVPVALDESVRDGRIKSGDIVLFVAFGGGFTWGATVMEWGNGK
jgi:3-oxoacyl-[acyl-carrier-protein] synthase-3